MVPTLPALTPSSTPELRDAWNQAHQRLEEFLACYLVADRLRLSQLTLHVLAEAVKMHQLNPQKHPTTLTLELARQSLHEWLEMLYPKGQGRGTSVQAGGHLALLIARIPQHWPESFLAAEIPAPLKKSLKQSLMITGPDLSISSMTPRELDYGPLLQIARQTWHRWDPRILTAFFFWVAVYFTLYGFFSYWIFS